MSQVPELPAGLIVVGANHRSSAVLLRDRIFVDDAAAPGFLAKLRERGITQALVLSTCDRVEVQAIHPDLSQATATVGAALAERAGQPPESLADQLYGLDGMAALHHVFCVAASLDSQVIGEPQVLGQIKASHRLARECGTMGAELDAVLQAAFAAAKRVRTETAIAEGPVSMAAAVVRLARDVHGDLARCTGLLVGGAEMGELMAEQLLSAGLGRLLVTAPAERQAETLGRRFDCHVARFEAFAAALADSDIVVCSVGTRRYVISGEMIEAVQQRRRRRPLLLVDAAVPGDIEPAVDRVQETFLYDLDDLERVALAGRATREAAAQAAHAILEEEIAAFCRLRAARGAAPAVSELRAHFEAVRDSALRDAGADAERATQLLVNRLLHDPVAALRDMSADGAEAERTTAERLLRRLFRIGSRAATPPAAPAENEERDDELRERRS